MRAACWMLGLCLLLVTMLPVAAAEAEVSERSTANARAGAAGPKIYRWVDAAGRVQYGSAPPPGVRIETVRVREQSLGADRAGSGTPAVPGSDAATDLVADGLDVVDRRNRTAPAPSYDWDAERPQRLAEHCGFIRDRVRELRSGQEWIVLDWGKPPTRLDGPRRVEELVRRERLLKQYCGGQ